VAYARVAFGCAVIALVSWAFYGTYVEGEDPLRGGGELISDFEPTPPFLRRTIGPTRK